MKRALSNSSSSLPSSKPKPKPKRYPCSSGRGTCKSPLEPLIPSPPLTLTHDSLSAAAAFQPVADRAQSIRLWAQGCSYVAVAVAVAVDPMSDRPSSRRVQKHTVRNRTPSPSKASPQYRSLNMSDARVYVDRAFEPPPVIVRQVAAVFASATPQADAADVTTETERRRRIKDMAERYYSGCRKHTSETNAGESVWRSHLWNVLGELSDLHPRQLRLNEGEKPWHAGLKPSRDSLSDILNFNFTERERERATPPTPDLRAFPSDAPFPRFSQPAPSVSDVSNSSIDSTGLTTPKPDITVGLSHESLTGPQKAILGLLQQNGQVLSDPHQSQMGLRFPFLIVEAKGLSATLFGAQNQAAVGGASAVNILAALEDVTPADSDSDSTGDNNSTPMVFSIVTEGPVHELWVHFQTFNAQEKPEYHMTLLDIWRPTKHNHAHEFIAKLACILEWGLGPFKQRVESQIASMLNLSKEELLALLGVVP